MERIAVIVLAPILALAGFTLIVQAQLTPSRTFGNSCVAEASTSANPNGQLIALGRALNIARQAAEATNGGLGQYRAASSMYGPISEAPCTAAGNGVWVFTFQGFAPGSTIPKVESVVSVNSQTWQVTVDRNTPL